MVTAVLETALDAAKKNNISTIVVASTTGDTAAKIFGLLKSNHIQLIVVTHDEGRPAAQRRFSEDMRGRLLASNVTVYTHNPRIILVRKILNKILGRFGLSTSWYKYLREVNVKYGTGIKVCHIIMQMLIEGNVVRDGKFVVVAGTKSGADSAAIFSASPQNKRPTLKEVIVSPIQFK